MNELERESNKSKNKNFLNILLYLLLVFKFILELFLMQLCTIFCQLNFFRIHLYNLHLKEKLKLAEYNI